MQERLQQIKTFIVDFWNKYTAKQKGIVFSILAVFVIAILILSYVMTRTDYVELGTYEDSKSAKEVMEALQSEGIASKVDSDAVTVLVDQADYNSAVFAIGSSDLISTGITYDTMFDNDMSTTESEKKRKATLATQNELRTKLKMMKGIEEATVFLDQPDDDYTILSEAQEASVSVILTLAKDSGITSENASNIATFLATAVGNKSTDNITIIDDKSNLLFGGEEDSLLGGTISSQAEYKEKLTNTIINNVEKVLLKYGDYSDVEVGAANIKFDMNKVSELYTEYTPAEDQEQGVLDYSIVNESENTSGSGGTPGTDSNDATEYEIEDGSVNSSTSSEEYHYKPNEKVTTTEYEVGAVVPKESSMAIVLTTYKVYNEEDCERQGLLEGTTWEDFITDNNIKNKLDVDEEVYQQVAMTTGIDAGNLSITAWEQPIFQEAESDGSANYDFIIMVVLAVLIFGLLLFIVFKVTKPVEVTDIEPELSVEQLLATTKENQSLEDIEMSEKSETRKMIEKFVDENPEAVAQLLRNWLNEDWG